MSDETTARLALPLIQPGQSQKEMFHNEALGRIDMVVQASVRGFGVTVPPTDPADGDMWVVGPTPTGAWAGQGDALAAWSIGGWRFVVPVEGMAVWVADDAVTARFSGGSWTVGDLNAVRLMIGGDPVVGARGAAIDDIAGGTIVDVEARDTLAAVLGALRTHGLIGI